VITTKASRHGAQRPAPRPGRLFIDGQWASSGLRLRTLVDPVTGEELTTAVDAGPQEANRAVAAARRAFDEGPWTPMKPRERGRILLRAAALIRERLEDFARLESQHTGKPLTFTHQMDVPKTIELFEYYAALASGLQGATRSTAASAFAYTRREPLGVVAAISPFNSLLVLSSYKIAPALAAGNTVVHKPADETPLTGLLLAEVLQEAGVPDGTFNVITGDGSVGDLLVRDPRVDKVAFTGSTAVGRRIAATAAETLKHITVELGGKSANVIFADADVEAAVSTAIRGFVFNTGQFCMARSRLLAKVHSFPDRARQSDVTILGGQDPAITPGGFWAAPTVLTGVSQDSPFVQEEIFGPVLTGQPFDSEEEAVRLANGTAYGLAAGLQTRDVTRAHRVAAALKAGIVWVNGWALLDIVMPFGGYNQSGYGRESGPEGLDEYLQTKSVVISLS
jgi:acyl-CoA reductase-like NAD-dependent aldehyde dehydrogenase